MTDPKKVIAGPAGHYYALLYDPQFGETLVGLPRAASDRALFLPKHPSDEDDEIGVAAGWYEITDPAPGVDDEALIAELKS